MAEIQMIPTWSSRPSEAAATAALPSEEEDTGFALPSLSYILPQPGAVAAPATPGDPLTQWLDTMLGMTAGIGGETDPAFAAMEAHLARADGSVAAAQGQDDVRTEPHPDIAVPLLAALVPVPGQGAARAPVAADIHPLPAPAVTVANRSAMTSEQHQPKQVAPFPLLSDQDGMRAASPSPDPTSPSPDPKGLPVAAPPVSTPAPVTAPAAIGQAADLAIADGPTMLPEHAQPLPGTGAGTQRQGDRSLLAGPNQPAPQPQAATGGDQASAIRTASSVQLAEIVATPTAGDSADNHRGISDATKATAWPVQAAALRDADRTATGPGPVMRETALPVPGGLAEPFQPGAVAEAQGWIDGARPTGSSSGAIAATADSAQPQDPRPVLRQMTEALVTTRGDRTEIALSPEELGRVRLVMSGPDRSHITIWAERPETLDLVRRNADLLTQQLAEAGVRTDSMSFRRDDRADWPDSAPQDRSDDNDTPALPESTHVRLTPAPLSDRRLDIRI